MESREGEVGRLAGLDTLRGIAILAVILFHVTLKLPGGPFGHPALTAAENQGVQLFFLVSAFTMGTMWQARAAERHRTTNFYVRRLCRIAPLYWAALVLYGSLNGWQPWPDVLANLLLVHSVLPSAINSVVPGGWSIGVEVAFYLAFPLIARVPPRWLLPLAFGWYAVVGIAAEALLASAGVDPIFLYYSPLTQLPVFLVGLYLYDLARTRRADRPVVAIAVALAWLALAVAARHAGLPGRPAFWIGVAALAALLWATVRYDVSVPGVRQAGRLSYSMYLLHFLVVDLVAGRLSPDTGTLPAFALVVAVTAALSWVSFATGERWSQALARRLVRRVPRAPAGALPAAAPRR